MEAWNVRLTSISTQSVLATTASRALPICESVKGNSGIDQNGFYLPETLSEFVTECPSDSSKLTSNLSMVSETVGWACLNYSMHRKFEEMHNLGTIPTKQDQFKT